MWKSLLFVLWSGISSPLLVSQEKPVSDPPGMDAPFLRTLAVDPHDDTGMRSELKRLIEPGLYRRQEGEEFSFWKFKIVRQGYLVQCPEGDLGRVTVWSFDSEGNRFRQWILDEEGRVTEFEVQVVDREIQSRSTVRSESGDPLMEVTYFMNDDQALVKRIVTQRNPAGDKKWSSDWKWESGPDEELKVEREPKWFFLLILLGWVVPTVGIVLWYQAHVRKREAQRTEELEDSVKNLGLDFVAEAQPALLAELGDFPVFKPGRSKELKNLITADTEDLLLSLFDYRYVTGHGKSKKTHRLTAVLVRPSNLRLPSCQLRPTVAIFDRIGSFFGMQDINFPGNPAFSKAFVLKADNEEEVRQFFDDPLLDFFAERPDICFELRPSGFVYYRQGKRVETEADKITEFFGEAYSVLKAIQERQDRSPSI